MHGGSIGGLPTRADPRAGGCQDVPFDGGEGVPAPALAGGAEAVHSHASARRVRGEGLRGQNKASGSGRAEGPRRPFVRP